MVDFNKLIIVENIFVQYDKITIFVIQKLRIINNLWRQIKTNLHIIIILPLMLFLTMMCPSIRASAH